MHYYAADLEAVVTEFPDLLTIPETVVSLTEAFRSQNAVGNNCNARLIAPHLNKQCGIHCHFTNTDCVND